MTATPARTTSLLASATLACCILATGSGAAASEPISGQSPNPAAVHLLAGDVRVWELAHPYIAEASNPLPGDVRVWDLIHSPAQ